MKILIKFNKKLSTWFIFINNSLFLIYNLSKIENKHFSTLFKSYFVLLRILRQFGLIKPLKNLKGY